MFGLDCSVTMAWVFQDEAGPNTDQLLNELRDDDSNAIVPQLWRLEVGNTLTQAERRGRITAAQRTTTLELVRSLPITTDAETDGRAFREILNLARTTSLTTYDASYLELTMRRGIPLATLDTVLIRAASGVAVKTLPA
jgi:predicted nucleic acid-binding protein